MRANVWFFLVLLSSALTAFAQQKTAPISQPSASPAIEDLGGGVFQIGKVRLDKNAKTVTFPVAVNMDRGVCEYLLVRAGGKTHESWLATQTEPRDLHIAMLLLGATDHAKENTAAPPDALNGAYLKSAPELAGDNVSLSVIWKESGQVKRASAEAFFFNNKEKAPMSRGLWIYNGSMLVNGTFLAQEERSIIALVIDPAALINNPRPGNRDDSSWEIDAKATPPRGTPMDIAIKLEASPEVR